MRFDFLLGVVIAPIFFMSVPAARADFLCQNPRSKVVSYARTRCPRGTRALINTVRFRGPQGLEGAPGPQGVAGPQGDQGVAGTPGSMSKRRFYLTSGTFSGDQVFTACASGFHFGSAHEFGNLWNSEYLPNLGQANDDGYGGPPEEVRGWVRSFGPARTSTGNASELANCDRWTGTTGDGASGLFHSGAPGTLVVSSFSACSTPLPVWCVEDSE